MSKTQKMVFYDEGNSPSPGCINKCNQVDGHFGSIGLVITNDLCALWTLSIEHWDYVTVLHNSCECLIKAPPEGGPFLISILISVLVGH